MLVTKNAPKFKTMAVMPDNSFKEIKNFIKRIDKSAKIKLEKIGGTFQLSRSKD